MFNYQVMYSNTHDEVLEKLYKDKISTSYYITVYDGLLNIYIFDYRFYTIVVHMYSLTKRIKFNWLNQRDDKRKVFSGIKQNE